MNDRKKTTKSEARRRAGAEAAHSVSNKAVKSASAEPGARAARKVPPAPPKSRASRKSQTPAAPVEIASDATTPNGMHAAPQVETGSASGREGKREGKSRSRPPIADLRVPGAPDEINTGGGARPSQVEAVTMAPPAKRARKAEASVESEDQIWSGDPTPAVSENEGSRLTRGSRGDPLRAAAEFGSAQSLLSTDYYFRQYGAHGMRRLAAEVDDFGFDPHVDEKLRPVLDLIAQKYFRVELVGAEQLPAEGRALLVANRGGTLPWDGLVLRSALRNARPQLSPLRWLAEDSVIHYPFMGVLMNRLGAVRACPENAERLLAQDRLVAVFPEGAQGSRKLFRDRYRLQRFGRGGYVKLALKFGVPILPTAIIGAEDTNPVLRRSRLLGRLVGSDTVPITPTFPWLGLAGLLPAPVRWRIAIGEPIDLSSYGPGAADDALVVHRLNEQIRSSLQALVDEHKTARGSSLFG